MEGRVEEKGGELGYEGADFPTVGYSTDGYKRKLEDSEGQRASKNPRSSSPDNYVSFLCVFLSIVGQSNHLDYIRHLEYHSFAICLVHFSFFPS